MKKLLAFVGTLGMLVMTPVLAFAQETPDPDAIGELVPAIIDAAKGGDWSLFVSLLLMILVWLATKVPVIDNWLPAKAKPWVATIAAVVLSIAMTAATTGDWLQAVLNGLVTGTAATGLWELVGKHVLKKKPEGSDEG